MAPHPPQQGGTRVDVRPAANIPSSRGTHTCPVCRRSHGELGAKGVHGELVCDPAALLRPSDRDASCRARKLGYAGAAAVNRPSLAASRGRAMFFMHTAPTSDSLVKKAEEALSWRPRRGAKYGNDVSRRPG